MPGGDARRDLVLGGKEGGDGGAIETKIRDKARRSTFSLDLCALGELGVVCGEEGGRGDILAVFG